MISPLLPRLLPYANVALSIRSAVLCFANKEANGIRQVTAFFLLVCRHPDLRAVVDQGGACPRSPFVSERFHLFFLFFSFTSCIRFPREQHSSSLNSALSIPSSFIPVFHQFSLTLLLFCRSLFPLAPIDSLAQEQIRFFLSPIYPPPCPSVSLARNSTLPSMEEPTQTNSSCLPFNCPSCTSNSASKAGKKDRI